jgi:hypothetical protein
MQRTLSLIATLLVAGMVWSGARANAAEPRYLLQCTSVWTKLNDAALTITTQPFTDVFEIDAAKGTVGGIHGEITAGEISWESVATAPAARAERTTHVMDRTTGKYVAVIHSFNAVSDNQDVSEYVGHCERYDTQR